MPPTIAVFDRNITRYIAASQESVQSLHTSVQPLHTFLPLSRFSRIFAQNFFYDKG
nr:MAG TPA: hypothetical protein [Caudoviricetes sp.]